MSEKRFEVILNEFDEVEYIMDKEMMEDRDFAEFMDFVELLARNKDEIVKENEQIIKIGLKWQGENPCATCVYPDPNVQKLCCAYDSPILIEEAMESFVQGLCVNYKRIRGL